ncbi:MEDS domain-containing protein (plasmid) [Novosphingobium resinovorum]|uniref:MEDS domain-containing protein n=1 Tax=Novosphingobium TaxID=165696 RepID=UPI001B3CA27A|nr:MULTISPECIES: MEDS domain-containing protein [Novosphingobium]MBF7015673.1 MEDS domain-containing protein [Novosphingobium sp. HR1a]WJM30347.1 MEDS domain-containing protein [Novosphingobium resinovorum]
MSTRAADLVESVSGSTDWDALSGHVCAIFRDLDEQYEVMMPFFRGGIERGERAYHTIDPARVKDHAERLVAGGIDVAAAIASGQLTINDWSQTFFDRGPFDTMDIIGMFKDLCEEGRELGYPRTRFFCEYEYAKLILNTDQMLEYEATMQMLGHGPFNAIDASICSYRIPEWTGQVLVQALRTHPTVILNGHIHENPFFEPPQTVISTLHQRQQMHRCC